MTTSARPAKHSEPRERLLRTASTLFYAKGIRAVGVEEVLAEANVTRATLYRHFGGKDDLIATYLRSVHQTVRDQIEPTGAAEEPAPDRIRAVARLLAEQITSSGFRGCAFLNAAAEFPDPESPAHQAVLEHRQWFLGAMTDLMRQAEVPDPEAAAQHFVMMRDGAMAAGCLGDAAGVAEVFVRGVDRMLTIIVPEQSPGAASTG